MDVSKLVDILEELYPILRNGSRYYKKFFDINIELKRLVDSIELTISYKNNLALRISYSITSVEIDENKDIWKEIERRYNVRDFYKSLKFMFKQIIKTHERKFYQRRKRKY